MIFLISVAGVTIALVADQVTKKIVETNMTYMKRIDIIGNLFGFRYVRNTGVAFGLFGNIDPIYLSAIVLGIISFLVFLSMKFKNQLGSIEKLFIGFLLGGALGNFIDRIRIGYVVDFLELPLWPIFNVADTLVVVSAISLLFSFYRRDRIASKNNSN